MVKKALGKSQRINQDGFKGYYTFTGAKLDSRDFYMTKDGHTYRFSNLRKTPKRLEDFHYAEYIIYSMHLADDYGEWDRLKESFIPYVKLSDVSGYQAELLSFKVHYREGEPMFNELEYYFRNDDTTFNFGVFEDGYHFDMYAYDMALNARNTSERVTNLQTANGLDLSRHQFERLYKIKRLIYRWEIDGFHYYLTVRDDRIEPEKNLAVYEDEFIRLIESVDKP